MDWIVNNWETIVAIVTGVVTLASIIVKLTPNETDNKILEKVIKFFELIGLNNKPVNSE